MEYVENRDGDTCKLELSGKFTFPDHEIFRGIVSIIKQGQFSTVVLEMSKVEFIDSAALGMLLIAREEAEKNNVKIILQSPSGQIGKMFKVSNFDSLFTIQD